MESSGEQREIKRDRLPDDHLGLLTVIAVFLLAGGWLWWKSVPFSSPIQRFNVLFSDVAGLNVNAPVLANGMRVGKVEKLELADSNSVRVQIATRTDKVRVPRGSSFKIYSNGIIGDKYVEIFLPHAKPGADVVLLDLDTIVRGTDPTRPEQIMEAIGEIAEDIDVKRIQSRLDDSLYRISLAADDMSLLSRKLHPAAERAVAVERSIMKLSHELTGTSRRINKLVDDPQVGRDFKETAAQAREAATRIQAAMATIKETLMDEPLRKDVLSGLDKLQSATANMRVSVETVECIGSDLGMRGDFKQIARDARKTMESVNSLLCDPDFGNDVKGTLHHARSAVKKMDLVAHQLSLMLDKRFPLLHLLFGRPGDAGDAEKLQLKEQIQQRLREQQTAAGKCKPVL